MTLLHPCSRHLFKKKKKIKFLRLLPVSSQVTRPPERRPWTHVILLNVFMCVCVFFFFSATSPNASSELEQARPQTSGEEELQLQLALAMSREAAEQVWHISHRHLFVFFVFFLITTRTLQQSSHICYCYDLNSIKKKKKHVTRVFFIKGVVRSFNEALVFI